MHEEEIADYLDLMLESIELIESRFLKIGFTLCKLCPWSIDEGLMSV